MSYDQLADEARLAKTVAALKANNMMVFVVENGEEAKKKVLEIIPAKAEVMQMTSVTLDDSGISKEINESGNYDAAKPKLYAMNRETQGKEMQQLGATTDWTVGSLHAITEEGQLMIASNTGSQLPAEAYSSEHVVFVVGTQKLVQDIPDGMNRIYQYTLPLESERAKKAYGVPGSAVNKLLIINKENIQGRITVVLVKEKLGF